MAVAWKAAHVAADFGEDDPRHSTGIIHELAEDICMVFKDGEVMPSRFCGL